MMYSINTRTLFVLALAFTAIAATAVAAMPATEMITIKMTAAGPTADLQNAGYSPVLAGYLQFGDGTEVTGNAIRSLPAQMFLPKDAVNGFRPARLAEARAKFKELLRQEQAAFGGKAMTRKVVSPPVIKPKVFQAPFSQPTYLAEAPVSAPATQPAAIAPPENRALRLLATVADDPTVLAIWVVAFCGLFLVFIVPRLKRTMLSLDLECRKEAWLKERQALNAVGLTILNLSS